MVVGLDPANRTAYMARIAGVETVGRQALCIRLQLKPVQANDQAEISGFTANRTIAALEVA